MSDSNQPYGNNSEGAQSYEKTAEPLVIPGFRAISPADFLARSYSTKRQMLLVIDRDRSDEEKLRVTNCSPGCSNPWIYLPMQIIESLTIVGAEGCCGKIYEKALITFMTGLDSVVPLFRASLEAKSSAKKGSCGGVVDQTLRSATDQQWLTHMTNVLNKVRNRMMTACQRASSGNLPDLVQQFQSELIGVMDNSSLDTAGMYCEYDSDCGDGYECNEKHLCIPVGG